MTVRTWITISALVLLALGAAFAVRVLSPIDAPALLASADGRSLEGGARGSCWPQRDGRLRCVRPDGDELPAGTAIRRTGAIRVVAAYPVQPDDGTLVIVGRESGEEHLQSEWTDRLRYSLEPGRYVLRADARYPRDAYVRYEFAFEIR